MIALAWSASRAVIVILSLYALGMTNANAQVADEAFLVFDGLLHQKKPRPAAAGMREFRGSGNLWSGHPPQDRIDFAGVQSTARYLRSFGDAFYLDIEDWPLLDVDAAEAERNIDKMIRVAEITRRTVPSAKFGIYGVLPQITYWKIVLDKPAELSAWRESNRRAARLAEHVDFVLPSLYTFYDDRAGWVKYAAATLEEARRYGKPVYAFLWPQYHDSNEQLRGRYLSPDFWRFQLDFVRQHADGVVLWGGYRERWDPDAPWWRETERFLESLRKP